MRIATLLAALAALIALGCDDRNPIVNLDFEEYEHHHGQLIAYAEGLDITDARDVRAINDHWGYFAERWAHHGEQWTIIYVDRAFYHIPEADRWAWARANRVARFEATDGVYLQLYEVAY